MKPWEMDEIRRAVKGKWLMRAEPALARRFNGQICTDSRKAADGQLFFAIAGKNHDAHAFIADVIDRGAAGIIVHRQSGPDVLAAAKARGTAIILVDDTVEALNRLAAAYRAGEYSAGLRAKVIAVGGSNGKTTTKRIIHALLAEKYGDDGGCVSPRSFNNNIGMPLTLLDVSPAHDYVVLEIGTNAPGEIAALGEVCRPDIAVVTSVGLEHLEKLGDLAGVAREEASIARYVQDGGTLILPANAQELHLALKRSKAQRILVGRDGEPADLFLTDVVEQITGSTFSINGRSRFFLPLLGEHNAMNALMAIAVARRMGLSDDQIAAGLRKVQPAEGRFQVLQAGNCRVIHDAYNANPSSMEMALRTFARLGDEGGPSGGRPRCRPGGGRRIVVLGDMLELGAAEEIMHRNVGALVAALRFDLFVAVGPAMRHAAVVAEAGAGGARRARPRVMRMDDTSAARAALAELLKPGDNILLKGSRGMAMETLIDAIGQPLGKTTRSSRGASRTGPAQ